MRARFSIVAIALITAACKTVAVDDGATTTTTTTTIPSADTTNPVDSPSTDRLFPPAPEVPSGPFSSGTTRLLDTIWSGLSTTIESDDIRSLGDTQDARVAWLIADLMRFLGRGAATEASVDALEQLTGVRFEAFVPWVATTDHLIAWDLPVPPEYADYKRRLFTAIDERWDFVFDEPNAIDERLLSWGGVFIDDRSLGTSTPCPSGCIPALDDPSVTPAPGGDWYSDDGIIFGIVVNGEARAYPKHMMEAHEMVNDTVGGRRIGIPYCTLCGSAQAFYLDEVQGGDGIVLRTSGLLSRSNKVMYDLESETVFDTFTGRAMAGPLFRAAVVLRQETVVTSTWGEWKSAHPATTILAEDGGIGRTYDLDPLRGRDDDGPIFPIGDRDLRLPVQEQVLGVVLPDGTPLAFPAEAAREALMAGKAVSLAGVTLGLDGDGLRATHAGASVPAHQAFWFAWSQFHPTTLLWEDR